MRTRALAALTFAAVLLGATPAQADVQWSARYGFGFGAGQWGDEGAQLGRTFLWENVLRVEALFGAPGDEHVRIGPALDLRTARFDTAEAAGGVSLLLPVFRGSPIVLTAAAGYAKRRDPMPDGPIFVGTFAWGYRSYDFHGAYGLGLQVFVTSRVALDDPARWEITAGIEIDLEAMIAIPGAFFVSLFRRGPPDEPE